MDAVEMVDVLRNLDRRGEGIEQILPTLIDDDTGETTEAWADIVLDQLRHDVRRLAEDLVAIEKRDAAQHGLVKGELAHVVRRIARLEAMPRLRQAR
jgi:predicted nuclease of restriction endonuclease-like RecB superfamily